MTDEERWSYLLSLDEEMLKGGVILSEWCTYIVRESDMAFAAGAYLASILMAIAGVETYLRSEYSGSSRESLFTLIDSAPITESLKHELHRLRKYRNTWVHVETPWKDDRLLEAPEEIDHELEQMAFSAVRVLREVIYQNPWV